MQRTTIPISLHSCNMNMIADYCWLRCYIQWSLHHHPYLIRPLYCVSWIVCVLMTEQIKIIRSRKGRKRDLIIGFMAVETTPKSNVKNHFFLCGTKGFFTLLDILWNFNGYSSWLFRKPYVIQCCPSTTVYKFQIAWWSTRFGKSIIRIISAYLIIHLINQ